MRVESPERFFNRLAPTTTDKQDQMIFSMQTFKTRWLSAATTDFLFFHHDLLNKSF
jgi:hypothetical protein